MNRTFPKIPFIETIPWKRGSPRDTENRKVAGTRDRSVGLKNDGTAGNISASAVDILIIGQKLITVTPTASARWNEGGDMDSRRAFVGVERLTCSSRSRCHEILASISTQSDRTIDISPDFQLSDPVHSKKPSFLTVRPAPRRVILCPIRRKSRTRVP